MPPFVGHAGARLRECSRLRSTDQIVQRALRRREAAVDREGAGDIGRVAAVFGTGIDQHQLAIATTRVVGAVMQHAGVAAAADDAAVCRPCVGSAEFALDLGLQFVLMHARPRQPHCRAMRTHTDVGSLLHQGDFVT